MLSMFVGLAWGAGAADVAQRHHVADAGLEVVIACAPLEPLAQLLPSLPRSMLEGGSDRIVPRLLEELGDAEEARLAGVDLDGALVVAIEPGDHPLPLIHVPFSGSRADAEQLLQRLSGQPVAASTEGWRIYDRGRPVDVLYAPGELVFRHAADRSTPVSGPPATILDGLPAAPGCVMWGRPEGREADAFTAFAAYVPTRGGAPMLLRADIPKLPAGLLQGANTPPIGGSSVEAPTVLMSLGAAPADLLRALAASEELGERMQLLAELEELEEKVRIGGGATWAFFGNPRAASFVAVIPMTDGRGRPLPPRKVARLAAKVLSEGGQKAQITGKGRVQGVVGDRMLFVAAVPGRLVVGSKADAVEEAATGVGTPWVTPEFQAFAASWALAVRTVPSEGLHVDMSVGLRGRPQGLEATVAVTGADAKSLGAMMGPMLGVATANFTTMQLKAKRAEVAGNVEGIRIAQLDHEAAFDAFVPAAPAPRAVDQLTKAAVPWAPNAGFEKVGWAPDGEVRGAYWVEVAADGSDFAVYGAIDADGDGVPVIYRATKDTGATIWQGGEDEY